MTRFALGLLFVVAPILMTAQGPAQKAAPATQAKFKAIWEPVNVKEDLSLASVHFVSPDEGWVAGGTTSMNGGVIVHTSDGGATWEIYRTADAGQTWSEVPGEIDGKPDFSFADAQVGWAAKYQKVLYTRDGGRTWLSSATKFPAMIEDSSLPARDRGYVVGEHGMVYRYRIVPADFNAKGILPAPAIAGAAR